jgi:hypothetical protein
MTRINREMVQIFFDLSKKTMHSFNWTHDYQPIDNASVFRMDCQEIKIKIHVVVDHQTLQNVSKTLINHFSLAICLGIVGSGEFQLRTFF